MKIIVTTNGDYLALQRTLMYIFSAFLLLHYSELNIRGVWTVIIFLHFINKVIYSIWKIITRLIKIDFFSSNADN